MRYLRKRVVPFIEKGARWIVRRVPGLYPLLRGYQSETRRARDMAALYRMAKSVRTPAERVLFWVPGGMPLMLHVEGAIAAALRLRGIDVHAIICDGPFRACVRRELKDGAPIARWHEVCGQCRAETSRVLEEMGISHSFIGDYVSSPTRAKLWEQSAQFNWETLDAVSVHGVRIGMNVRSAIVRYLQGEELKGRGEVVREYVNSALLCAHAAVEAMDRLLPTRIFMSHGTYVDWGPALQLALVRKLPVAAWMASYLPARFYFRHVEDPIRIDFHNMSHHAWSQCQGSPLTDQQRLRLDQFLINRYRMNIRFDMKHLKEYSGQTISLRRKYAPVSGNPVWGIMAHINWDCVCDYSPMAYDSFDDWMVDTVREIQQIRDVQWLIKIHPAEAWDNPTSGVQRLIHKHFPTLPEHIRVIPAEEEISPLDFYKLVDGGVSVYGTAGLELALLGKPVILGGEAHYGGKGFTYDGLTRKSYRQFLQMVKKMKPLSEEQQQLARKYAYCYFIQRQIPLRVVQNPKGVWWEFQEAKRELLLPGKDPFIDFLAERILDGRDFIMDEQLTVLSELIG